MLKGNYVIPEGAGCYPIIIEDGRVYQIQESYDTNNPSWISIKELETRFETWRRGEGD